MIIGFTGTKEGMTTQQRKSVLSFIITHFGQITEAHHSDCIGADMEFHEIITQYAISVIIHPPINNSKRAFCQGTKIREEKEYIKRNHDIVEECDWLIATPKTAKEILRSGTWATIRYAKKLNKKILICYP